MSIRWQINRSLIKSIGTIESYYMKTALMDTRQLRWIQIFQIHFRFTNFDDLLPLHISFRGSFSSIVMTFQVQKPFEESALQTHYENYLTINHLIRLQLTHNWSMALEHWKLIVLTWQVIISCFCNFYHCFFTKTKRFSTLNLFH